MLFKVVRGLEVSWLQKCRACSTKAGPQRCGWLGMLAWHQILARHKASAGSAAGAGCGESRPAHGRGCRVRGGVPRARGGVAVRAACA